MRVLLCLLLVACTADRPRPDPEPASAAPVTLLSHAHDPREVLVFEHEASRPFLDALARSLDVVNGDGARAGLAPVALTVLHPLRDRHAPEDLPARRTPIERVAVDLRAGVWIQDVTEIGLRGARVWLLDPRRSADGADRLLASLARRWGAVREAPPAEPRGARAANGGGNVEVLPEGTLLLGRNAGPALAELLFASGYRARHVRVDTDFLAIGHVDELFSHVVTGPDPCDFALLVASPERGLATAGRAAEPDTRFVRVQRALEARIGASRSVLREAIGRRTPGCRPPVVALPVTFDCRGEATAPRDCRTTEPNPLNAIVLRRHVILADPGRAAPREVIAGLLRAHGQVPHFVPARVEHASGGGPHCASNVRRSATRWAARARAPARSARAPTRLGATLSP